MVRLDTNQTKGQVAKRHIWEMRRKKLIDQILAGGYNYSSGCPPYKLRHCWSEISTFASQVGFELFISKGLTSAKSLKNKSEKGFIKQNPLT